MKKPYTIRQLFSLPGFVANSKLRGVFGDRYARVIVLRRRKKQASAHAVAIDVAAGMTNECAGLVTCQSPVGAYTLNSSDGGSFVQGAVLCL